MVELEWTIVQRGDVGVDVGVFSDHGNAFAFVGMPQMRQDDLDVRKTNSDRIQVAGKRTVQGRLGDEGGSGMEKYGKAVFRGVAPERIERRVVRSEAGVHRE